MAKATLVVFFLVMLVETTVCDAVYKLVNSSVQLDIKKYSQISNLFWTFNHTKNIVFPQNGNFNLNREYKDRVEFTKETHSLTLKNLQKNDSGVYKAEISAENREVVATFELYVLDPVEEPALNYTLQKNNETCNMTLTCKAQNLSVTSYCYSNNCSTETARSNFYSLSLYVSESFIICNHSNPLGWKIKQIKEVCFSEGEKNPEPIKNPVSLTIIIVLSFIGGIGMIIFFWSRKKRQNIDVNTCYEDVAPFNKGSRGRQPSEMSNSHESPATVYCTVGMPGQPSSDGEGTVSTASPSNKDQEAETNGKTAEIDLPQTVYATVNKL